MSTTPDRLEAYNAWLCRKGLPDSETARAAYELLCPPPVPVPEWATRRHPSYGEWGEYVEMLNQK